MESTRSSSAAIFDLCAAISSLVRGHVVSEVGWFDRDIEPAEVVGKQLAINPLLDFDLV